MPAAACSSARQFSAKLEPSNSAARANRASASCAGFSKRDGLQLWLRRNSIPGRASASDFTSSSMCPNSVRSARRNLRRAGTAWNRSCTSTQVPTAPEAGCGAPKRAPAASMRQACSASRVREVSCKRDTEVIDASASPRKPMLATRVRSSKLAILLVACAAKASGNSSHGMPAPSSRTRISRAPPCAMSISIFVAPASRLFSTSSFTTDAGRSITSPAAIWLTSSGDSGRIGIGVHAKA